MQNYIDNNPILNQHLNNPLSFDTAVENIGVEIPSTSLDFSSTLKGIGTGIGLISGIVNSNRDNRMKKKLYNLEKDRIDRANRKQDKFEADMKKAWG